MRRISVTNLSTKKDTSAESLIRNLQWAQQAFAKNLPENRRAVVRVSSNGQTIRMDGAQWINPTTVIFHQYPQSEGETMKVIVQHFSQVSVLFESEEIVKDEKPRQPIGFGPAE